MTAATIAHKRARFPMLLVVGLAAVAGLLLVSVPPLNQHALERHPSTAPLCRQLILDCDPDDPDYFEGVTDEGTIYRMRKFIHENGKEAWVLFITVAVGITASGKVKERTVTTYTVRKEKRVKQLQGRCR